VKIAKPKLFSNTRDLIISLAVLAVVMVISVGFTGLCSFNPGPADKEGAVQEVDIETILKTDAQGLSVPVRLPALPDNWVPNSGRRVSVDGQPSSVAGWVIDGKEFISLTQTDAATDKAVDAMDDKDGGIREETGEHRTPAAASSTGKDVTWRIWTGDDSRPLWVADTGDARLLLTGTAGDDQFATLADAVVKAQPL
jgi:hypothetical protein